MFPGYFWGKKKVHAIDFSQIGCFDLQNSNSNLKNWCNYWCYVERKNVQWLCIHNHIYKTNKDNVHYDRTSIPALITGDSRSKPVFH